MITIALTPRQRELLLGILPGLPISGNMAEADSIVNDINELKDLLKHLQETYGTD